MTKASFQAGILPNRAVLSVGGEDARDFLHNILTCDIAGLKEDELAYGALLSPQGKMLADLFVYDDGNNEFSIDCAQSQLEFLLKKLSLYKLRSRVTIANDDHFVFVSPDDPENPFHSPDPRTPLMGWRAILPDASRLVGGRPEIPDAVGYDAARIAAGLADTDMDLSSGEFFPHEANFDQIGAVSFTKGCYIGQEVVSRMEHRGTARSRILPVRFDGAAPAKGSDIRAGEKSIGTVLGSEGDMALALIRLDKLAEAQGPLVSEGVSVEVLKPQFARYDVPGIKD